MTEDVTASKEQQSHHSTSSRVVLFCSLRQHLWSITAQTRKNIIYLLNNKDADKKTFLPVALTQVDSCSLEISRAIKLFSHWCNGFFKLLRSQMWTQSPWEHAFTLCRSHGSFVSSQQRSHFKPNLYLMPLKLGWVDWIFFMILSRADNTIHAMSVHSTVLSGTETKIQRKEHFNFQVLYLTKQITF